MMRRSFLLLCLIVGSVIVADVLPDAERLNAVVTQLGAEAHDDRQEASEILAEYTARFPRYMLVELAERYAETEDLEVRFRLEDLLIPLAGRYLFGVPAGFIGINMEWGTDAEGTPGVRVLAVLPGHAGDAAGLRAGDLIVRVEEDSVEALGSLQAFSERIAGVPPGTIVRFNVLRDGEMLKRHFPLDARPNHLDVPLTDWRVRVADWFRKLAGRDGPEDPAFPVGHFPMDDGS